MNSRIRLLSICLVFLNFNIYKTQAISPPIQASELNIRKGLPNLFAKIEKGDTIRVGYLGGSITAQKGWRVYSLQWMKEKFPKTNFVEINAAIGGTGSDFGAFRLNEQVLKYKPDLLFIEFAVNDGSTSETRIIRSMEGIVRQTWQSNPYTDICFVYTIKMDFLEDAKNGILPRSAQTMEKVADNYGIPTINFGFEVADQVKNNKLIFTHRESMEKDGIPVFCPDNVHPYVESGHVIYQEVLERSFDKIEQKGKSKLHAHKMRKPLDDKNFSQAKMLDYSKFELSNDWEFIKISEVSEFSKFGRFLNSIAKAGQSDQTITVHFKGKTIGFYDIRGYDAGRVIVEIDGVVTDTISRFDRYCTYRRMSYTLIDDLEDKEHVVVFSTLSEHFDKAAILTNKNDIAENPEKYKENNWYVGKILIDGELLK